MLELTSHGLSTLEIAERLFIEPGTVRTHVSAILKKLHALNGSLPGDWPNTTNTAIASWSAQQLASDGDLAAGSADFTVPVSSTENPTDNCADVTDSIAGDLSGGNVCVGDPGDVNGTFTFQYQWTFYGPAAGTCATIPNTATFADNSIPQSTGSAGASVRLCSFSARLTPGYWKNHLGPLSACTGLRLPLGTSCGSNGPWTNSYLPRPLGAYSVNTVLKAASVFALMNCSNTGSVSQQNQNAIGCLTGHLLASELNVANGGNPCINTVIAKANTFLTNPPATTVVFGGYSATSINYIGPSATYSGIGTAQRNLAIALKTAFDSYNNGGYC